MGEENFCIKEEIISDIKVRVEKLEASDREDYGARRELALSLKLFAQSNEKQSKAISDISETLLKVNNNLDNLNKDNKEIKDDVVELKTDVYNKFNQIEEQFGESEEKNKIDIRDVNKEKHRSKLMTIGIPIAAIFAIVGFISSIVQTLQIFHMIK